LEPARRLASALAAVLAELIQSRHALRDREAELAAGVPVISRADERQHLAARLEAVLRGGAEAVGCHAAALYLLDDATSQLKQRASWGLPPDRLAAPARPLQGAVADLEALLGHAVALEDADALRFWNTPEDFPAAACVPVSTPTTILGTLWVFCNRPRRFSAKQTNMLEVVAGRLASDLEREILLRESQAAKELSQQVAAAERLQRNQLPTMSPLLDGWELAGWTAQGGPVGGDFHDWFCVPGGRLAFAVGHALDGGIDAALAASALKAALRSHGQYHGEPEQTLQKVNLTMWTGSAGDQFATLFYGLIDTATGRVCCASAGRARGLLVRPCGWQTLSSPSPQLGTSPETTYQRVECQLQAGEALVLFAAGCCQAADAAVAELLQSRLDLSAEEMTVLVRRQLESQAASCAGGRSVLVVKRTAT
jgi:hypothetical protein